MPRVSMKKRIDYFVQKLEALPYSKTPSDDFLRLNFYPFSNERGLDNILKTCREMCVDDFPANTIRVAVLIGQSSFCTLLSTLSRHCDLIVFNDINPYLIQHTRKLLALVQTSQNRIDFERQYKLIEKELLKDFYPSQTTPNLNMRKQTLGEDHFLFSDENFNACKKAATTLRFAFSHVNLFNRKDQKRFFELFHRRKCEITFFNATNLYEWAAKKPLAQLKSAKEWAPNNIVKSIFTHMKKYSPIVMFSTRENAIEACPLRSQLCFSSQDYFDINKRAADQFLQEKFRDFSAIPDFILYYADTADRPDESCLEKDSVEAPVSAPSSPSEKEFVPYFQSLRKKTTCVPNSAQRLLKLSLG